jgi:hypothetical protein
MDMDFAIICPPVRPCTLQSGSRTSAPTLAPRFFQTPPRGDAFALRYHFTSISRVKRTFTFKLSIMLGTQTVSRTTSMARLLHDNAGPAPIWSAPCGELQSNAVERSSLPVAIELPAARLERETRLLTRLPLQLQGCGFDAMRTHIELTLIALTCICALFRTGDEVQSLGSKQHKVISFFWTVSPGE